MKWNLNLNRLIIKHPKDQILLEIRKEPKNSDGSVFIQIDKVKERESFFTAKFDIFFQNIKVTDPE